jgi:hypothetical protein
VRPGGASLARAAGLLMVLMPGVAGAQSPDAAASPPAPVTADGVKAHVFASGGYVSNFNQPPSRVNALRVFDFADHQLRLDVAELTVEKSVAHPRDFGFRVDLEAGFSIPRVSAAAGLFHDSNTGAARNFDVQQAYVSWIAPAGSGLRLDVGKFVTLLGLEVIEGWDGYNDNASRSLLFGYAIPFTHTGVKIGYAFTPKMSGAVAVVQGWDNVRDNNTAKSVVGSLTLAPNEAVTIGVNAVSGPEQNDDNHDVRTVVDVVATWKATATTTLGVNLDGGREAHAALSGGTASWQGVAAYLRHAFTKVFAVAVRGEVFNDPGGARTGTAQRVGEITLTPEVRLSAHALIRVDLRVDRSSQAVFDSTSGGMRTQPTAGVNVVVH